MFSIANFIKYNYKQDIMLAINFEEQLQPGTFEHAIHYLIDNKIDLSNFHPKFKNKDTGRPAYDPAILIKILLFAYSKGITSSPSMDITTSKGTIQGYNGVATVDKKHQIIIDAQVFGAGQERHTLKPVIEKIKLRYRRLGISENIYKIGTVVTADTGFANEVNMKYLYENEIDGYIPDNQFRSRDPKFTGQKNKYGKRHQLTRKVEPKTIPSREFKLDAFKKICICSAGKSLKRVSESLDPTNNYKLFFTGDKTSCHDCHLKNKCMKNPDATKDGRDRQVSFILKSKTKSSYTDWMKERVDSQKGKLIYSHRMSVVGR